MSEEAYVGPCGLREALSLAERKRQNGMALAVSVPDGRFVALEVGGVVRVRRAAKVSGHGGSVTGSGEWVREENVAPTVLWRPL